MTSRTGFIIGITVLAVVAALLAPATPQWLSYHDFPDSREMFGVPNFLNVGSNIAFLIVGIFGLFMTLSRRARFQFDIERWPYVVFFVGVLFTAAGSAYYHLLPDNTRLFWDRLPMTVAFMALISSQIVDRISIRAGVALLLPMLLVGAASVVYWRITENAGVGTVMPYGILQAYSVIILLTMTALMPSRYTLGNHLYWVFAWYLASKLFETFDQRVLLLGHVVSGHTLKHLAAAAAGIPIFLMLIRRTLVTDSTGWSSEVREVQPRLLVFDGYCNVCSGWARFLEQHQVRPRFRLIPMQSIEGRALLTQHGIDADDPLTFLVIDGGNAYLQSDATIHLLAEAGGIWRVIRLAHFAPRALRDGLYLLVARNRYRWFGRRATCFLPDLNSEGTRVSNELDTESGP